MMKTNRIGRIAPLMLLLAACGGKTLKTFDLGTPATAQTDAYVDSEKPKAAEGTKRIVIPYFQVEFVQQSSAANVDRSDESIVTLTGVSATQFQAIANDFYDGVVADLKAAGLDVVPIDQMSASPEFKALASHGFKSSPDTVQHMDNISKFYAPHGMQVYYLPGDERFAGVATNKKSKDLGSALSAFAGVMKGTYGGAAYNFANEEVGLAKALGAKVLRVRVVVDFADVNVKSDQTVSTSVHLSFAAKDSFYRFNGPDGEGGFFLKQPMISSDHVAEKKRAGSILRGGATWEAAADGAAYETSVRAHLAAFRGMMMAKVKGSL